MKLNIKTNLIRKIRTILKKEDRKVTHKAIEDVVNIVLEIGLTDHEIGSGVNSHHKHD